MSLFDITPAGVFVDAVEIASKRAREHELSRPLPPKGPPVHVRLATSLYRARTKALQVIARPQPRLARR